MKTTTLLLLTVFLLGKAVYAQTEKPQWVNVSPFPDNFNGMVLGCFISADEGWIFKGSEKGSILYHTTDGAARFDTLFRFPDTTTYFHWLQMTNSKTGYATAVWQDSVFPYTDFDLFLKTTDGGKSWTDIYDSAFFAQFPYDYMEFYFINSLTGFTSQSIDGKEWSIYKTTDGTKTWQKTEIVITDTSRINLEYVGYVDKFFFVDELHGWAICSYGFDTSICLATTDGGLTWTYKWKSNPSFGLHFVSPLKGGIVGYAWSSHVYLTENNFETYSYKYNYWQQNAEAIVYQNDSIIWISGDPATLYRSSNSGQTFEQYQKISTAEKWIVIFEMAFFGNTGYAFGSKNSLFKFEDTLDLEIITRKNSVVSYLDVIPNPAKDIVEIILPNESTGNLMVYNSVGVIVYKKQVNVFPAFIDVSPFYNGIYLVVFTNKKGISYRQKLIKYN